MLPTCFPQLPYKQNRTNPEDGVVIWQCKSVHVVWCNWATAWSGKMVLNFCWEKVGDFEVNILYKPWVTFREVGWKWSKYSRFKGPINSDIHLGARKILKTVGSQRGPLLLFSSSLFCMTAFVLSLCCCHCGPPSEQLRRGRLVNSGFPLLSLLLRVDRWCSSGWQID